eukprot:275864_1
MRSTIIYSALLLYTLLFVEVMSIGIPDPEGGEAQAQSENSDHSRYHHKSATSTFIKENWLFLICALCLILCILCVVAGCIYKKCIHRPAVITVIPEHDEESHDEEQIIEKETNNEFIEIAPLK